MPVLVGSWAAIDGLMLGVPGVVRELVAAFWPGGLSLVLTHAPSLAWARSTTRRLQLGDSVSVYVEGYVTSALPSTIIDLTTPGEPWLLREGAVSAHAISEVIGHDVSLVS